MKLINSTLYNYNEHQLKMFCFYTMQKSVSLEWQNWFNTFKKIKVFGEKKLKYGIILL